MRRRATAQVRNSFPVRCIVAGIHVRTAEIGFLVVLVAGTAKRIYQGGEESDAAFFVYFADTVRLQQLVNASAFFVCQVEAEMCSTLRLTACCKSRFQRSSVSPGSP